MKEKGECKVGDIYIYIIMWTICEYTKVCMSFECT